MGSYKDSKDIVERGIELCREHDSLFILDELYLIRGKDELALGEDKQAKETLEIARSISIARRESFVKDEIAAELKKLK